MTERLISRRQTALLLAALLISCGTPSSRDTTDDPAPQERGIPVTEVTSGEAADLAGIRAGDRLLSWTLDAKTSAAQLPRSSGSFETSFDVTYTNMEMAPRGNIRIVVQRNGRSSGTTRQMRLTTARWGLVARHPLDDDTTAAIEAYEASTRAADSRPAESERLFRIALSSPSLGDEQRILLLRERARELLKKGATDQARTAYQDAVNLTASARDRGLVLDRAARDHHFFSGPQPAIEYWRASLEIWRERGDDLLVALTTHDLAASLSTLGQLDEARQLNDEAHSILSELAPDSLLMARVLSNRAKILSRKGNYEAADHSFQAALEMRQRLLPGSREVAVSTANLGTLHAMRGDLASAQRLFEDVERLWRELDPKSRERATNLGNLGAIVARRGDLFSAERFHRLSLELREERGERGLGWAWTLGNLASIALKRHDDALAETMLQESVDIQQELAPRGDDLPWNLERLASLALRRHDTDRAERLLQQALTLRRRQAEDSPLEARTLRAQAQVERARADEDRARELLSRAIRIYEADLPGTLDLALTKISLAEIELGESQATRALNLFREALPICAAVAPGSLSHARAHYGVASALKQLGDLDSALLSYEAAASALDTQQRQLGGTDDSRATFAERHREIFDDYIDLLLRMGRPTDALVVLERSRAKEFRRLLAERDLVFSSTIDPSLDRRRRMAEAEYETLLGRLLELSVETQASEVEELLRSLRKVRNERDRITSEARATSSRYATLDVPEIDLMTDLSALAKDELVLSFHLAEEGGRVFAADRDGLVSVAEISLSRDDLIARVRQIRLLASREGPPASLSALQSLSAELYDQLLGGLHSQIESYQRLVVVPDGPLHLLPFALLIVPSKPFDDGLDGKSERGVYLVESKAVRTVGSLGVLGALERRRLRSAAPRQMLVAMADPISSSTRLLSEDPVRSFVSARSRALPWARREVQEIAELVGGGADVFLGEQASEARIKANPISARFLHFAVHGFVDARVPWDSGLALAVEPGSSHGGEDGLLQTWEVIEQLRLETELVALSGCDTALGKTLSGEGLMGLVRAFQYAGTGSVLASLWSVSDRSTSELMTPFYRHVLSGLPKDEALRRAQLELLHDEARKPGEPSRRHPFHWAAMRLDGLG